MQTACLVNELEHRYELINVDIGCDTYVCKFCGHDKYEYEELQ